MAGLADRTAPRPDPQFPYVLSAGERRAFTAGTIMRDPVWRPTNSPRAQDRDEWVGTPWHKHVPAGPA
ncbi:MAG: hypothetical protein U0R23_10965 [Candidatus Nanopelagicales bacterium]